MKKELLSIVMIFALTAAIAQTNNCAKFKQLVVKANTKTMAGEATQAKFMTPDDFAAWTAVTTLEGATKCYVQDAGRADKMYVAEFGTSPAQTADAALIKKADALAKSIRECFNGTFGFKEMKSDGFIFRAYEFTGKGENANTKITLMLVYNPGEKTQKLFITILND